MTHKKSNFISFGHPGSLKYDSLKKRRNDIKKLGLIPLGFIVSLFHSGISFSQDEAAGAVIPKNTAVASPQASNNVSDGTDWDKINDLSYNSQGLTTRFPPQQFTIFNDKGGWRSDLASHNIGIESRFLMSGGYSLTPTDAPAHSYVGQDGDISNAVFNLYGTYGLADLGLPDAKVNLCANVTARTLEETASQPGNDAYIGCLTYYQTFLNKSIGVKVGWQSNVEEYVGLYAGGDSTLTNTLSSLIPVQAGMSDPNNAQPLANVTWYGKDGFYAKGGVQQSLSAFGRGYNSEHNGIGLSTFDMKRSDPLYISEVGINRDPAPNQKRLWFRVGGLYNTTEYDRFKGGQSEPKAFWAGVDYQFTQPNSSIAVDGWYAGFSALYAPEDTGLFTQSYNARLYQFGPVKSRPFDRLIFSATYNKFSSDAREAAPVSTESNQLGLSAGYSISVTRGVIVFPNIGYTKHPSFTPTIDHALLANLSIITQF